VQGTEQQAHPHLEFAHFSHSPSKLEHIGVNLKYQLDQMEWQAHRQIRFKLPNNYFQCHKRECTLNLCCHVVNECRANLQYINFTSFGFVCSACTGHQWISCTLECRAWISGFFCNAVSCESLWRYCDIVANGQASPSAQLAYWWRCYSCWCVAHIVCVHMHMHIN